MSPPVTHSNQDGTLHFVASGAMNNGENTYIWDHVQTVALEHTAQRILIECDAACGRISMEHCFDLIEKMPTISRRLGCKIALFEKHMSEEAREVLKFVETSVTDRGARFKIFFDLEEAQIWLRK